MAPSPEFPYQDGDVTVLGPEIFASSDGAVICWKGVNYVPQNRLRLAHQARRAKEHQLDSIRRALCDIGFMEDDDPYSHADLEDVIRQNGQALADASGPAPAEAADDTAPCPNCGPPGLCPKHCPCRECSAQIGAAVRADIERQMRYLRTQGGGI